MGLDPNIKCDFFDNSLKPNTDCSFVDWVVFAGTPEWSNGRTYDLYKHVLSQNIPVMILGVGGGADFYRPAFREVVSRAKACVVRDKHSFEVLLSEGFTPTALSCPALLSAPAEKERKITEVRTIALIYQATHKQSVIFNGCSDEAYAYQMRLLHEIIQRYRNKYKIKIICHYIDEVPLAINEFPDFEVLYSYDAKDYLDFYRQCDFACGMRVHGIGAAASVGVPGLAIEHSPRSQTCAGFLADIVSCTTTSIEDALIIFENAILKVSEKSQAILRRKSETMEAYCRIVEQALKNPDVSYSTPNFDDVHHLKTEPAGTKESFSLEQKAAELIDQLDVVLRKAEAAEPDYQSLRQESAALKQENATLKQENAHLNQNAQTLHQHLDEFLQSTSWRITAPLRVIGNYFRKRVRPLYIKFREL